MLNVLPIKPIQHKKAEVRKGLPYPSDIFEVTQRRKLTSRESLLLHVLTGYMNRHNRLCWASEETLGKEMGCSRTTVNKTVQSLRRKGLIIVRKVSMGKGMGFPHNIYSIVFPWLESGAEPGSNVSRNDKRVSTKSSHVCTGSEHTYVKEFDSNQSKRIIKRNSQHQYGQNDDDFSLCLSKPTAVTEDDAERKMKKKKMMESGYESQIGSRANGSQENDYKCEMENNTRTGKSKQRDNETEIVSQTFDRKIQEPDDLLKQFYHRLNIPEKINLLQDGSQEIVDLNYLLSPFKGKGKALTDKYGTDLDKPRETYWEGQAEDFYDRVIAIHWNPHSYEKPGVGFKKTFLRACRAGVMTFFAFDPKTGDELEIERVEREERLAKQEAQAKLHAEEERKKSHKDNQLRLFIKDPAVHEYFLSAGILSDGQETDLDVARQYLKTLKVEHGLKLKDDVIKFAKAANMQRATLRKRTYRRKLMAKTLKNNPKLFDLFVRKKIIPCGTELVFLKDEVFDRCIGYVASYQEELYNEDFDDVLELIQENLEALLI
jgi:hypothetical protein